MKKSYQILLIFLLSSCLSFALNITKVSSSAGKMTLYFDGKVPAQLTEVYDEDSRVLFLELPNCSLKKGVKVPASKYLEEGNIEDYGGSVGWSCRFQRHLSYKLKKNKKSLDILFLQSHRKKLIVIDAGHGGKDPGTNRGKYREKDIALAIAKNLRRELSKNYEVLMTRDKDYFVSLSRRPKMGNQKHAKLFVSIHVNAAGSSKADGVEVYYFSKKSSPYAERIAQYENSFGDKYGEKTSSIAQISGEVAYKRNQMESIPLAEEISRRISKRLYMRNRGAHGANFAVLRGFNGPSILVETGFISNPSDLKKLSDPKKQKAFAEEIAKGIETFFNR